MKRVLVAYSDSSDEDSTPDKHEPIKKRKLPTLSSHLTVPVPIDDPTKHQGRVRSSPHVEGQWAAYVYVPVALHTYAQRPLRDLVCDALRYAQEVVPSVQSLEARSGKTEAGDINSSEVSGLQELHVSLTRPFFLRAHQREDMKRAVRAAARLHPPYVSFVDEIRCIFTASFATFSELTNDEKTRTFLCMEVGAGHAELRGLSDSLSPKLREFRQKQYYEDPRFHASFAWALLDASDPSSRSRTDEAVPTITDAAVPAPVSGPLQPQSASPAASFPTIPHFPPTLVPGLNAEFAHQPVSKVGTFEVGELRIRIGQDVSGWSLGA
ncbi:hypothetical protein BV25DRAFT_660240 [Artomyces pyxidatus]|uniref:Uncharacterized protein n=1 Tax=Artomyces pyxidatus TaxID=48021 RepID=A0ACB8T1F5_9AGAM|nr:hypothetical protein BV25DRAFT_660240 [Artomyces pyxidatus]